MPLCPAGARQFMYTGNIQQSLKQAVSPRLLRNIPCICSYLQLIGDYGTLHATWMTKTISLQ